VIETRRFEVPNRYRHLERLYVRYASWDLTQVHLLDERTDRVLCRLFPQDKARNANGTRRPLEPLGTPPQVADRGAIKAAAGIAPLLAHLIAQQAATGLPPAYLPKDDLPNDEGEPS